MNIFKGRITEQQREILEAHNKEAPVKLGQLAADLGLKVSLATLPHGISGQITRDSSAPSGYAIRVNRHESKKRQRFTLAHEIAHFLLHQDKIGDGVSESVLYRAPGITNREEVEANRLAAEIVVPRGLLSTEIEHKDNLSREELCETLANLFAVSQEVMEIRLGIR